MRIACFVIAAALLLGPGDGLAATAPPSLVSACGSSYSSLGARPVWLRASDGTRLYAIAAGAGSTAVVLAHQGRSDLCEELPYAQTLLAHGLQVLAFDFRDNGRSDRAAKSPFALGRDLAAAVRQARNEGAKRVFVVGASMGGAAAVQNGAGLPVAGLVSLSGTRLWPGYGINRPGPGALGAPFLYVGSKSDWRAPTAAVRSIFDRVGSSDKRQVLYPGSLHGWQLVQDAPFAASARALILRWIRAHS